MNWCRPNIQLVIITLVLPVSKRGHPESHLTLKSQMPLNHHYLKLRQATIQDKRQYLLTCKVSRYCLLALHGSISCALTSLKRKTIYFSSRQLQLSVMLLCHVGSIAITLSPLKSAFVCWNECYGSGLPRWNKCVVVNYYTTQRYFLCI